MYNFYLKISKEQGKTQPTLNIVQQTTPLEMTMTMTILAVIHLFLVSNYLQRIYNLSLIDKNSSF